MHDITEYAIKVDGKVIEVEFRNHADAVEYKREWLQWSDPGTVVEIVHRRVRYDDWHLTTD